MTSFHCSANFYRKFIRNFSCICAPVIKTIKKEKQPFHWKTKFEKGFRILKKNIIEQPLLKFPYFSHPFPVKCDASGTTIGVVVSQYGKRVA